MIAKIPYPEIHDAIQEEFNLAAHAAFRPIYLFTAGIALLFIIFSRRFKRDEIESANEEESQE